MKTPTKSNIHPYYLALIILAVLIVMVYNGSSKMEKGLIFDNISSDDTTAVEVNSKTKFDRVLEADLDAELEPDLEAELDTTLQKKRGSGYDQNNADPS